MKHRAKSGALLSGSEWEAQTTHLETVSSVAAAGAAETLDVSTASVYDLTLDENLTITLTGAEIGEAAVLTVVLTQDASGGNTITWPGSVVWPGGTSPAFDTTAGSVSIVNLFTHDGGATWYGFLAAGGGLGEFPETDTVSLGGGDVSTNSTTFANLTGYSVTQTTAAVRLLVIFTGMGNNSAAGQTFYIDVDIDGTRVSSAANGLTSVTGQTAQNLSFTFLTDVLSAGSHTIKLVGRVTANLGAIRDDGTNYQARFTVLETSQTA